MPFKMAVSEHIVLSRFDGFVVGEFKRLLRVQSVLITVFRNVIS